MALVTTCPACQSTFFVTPDQLAAHRGDVRCGKCRNVFNALSALNQLDETPTPPPSEAVTTIDSVIAETETLVAEAIQEELEQIIDITESIDNTKESPPQHLAELTSHETEALVSYETASSEVAEDDELEALTFETPSAATESTAFRITQQNYASDDPLGSTIQSEEPLTSDLDSERPSEPSAESTSLPPSEILPSVAEETTPAPISESPVERELEAVAPSTTTSEAPKHNYVEPSYTGPFADSVFIEKEASTTRQRWVTVLLSLLFIGLTISAAAQVVYFYRTEISVRWPQTSPILHQTCRVLHCTIPLPHDITAMVIDDSEIQEDQTRQGVIRLNTTLINTSNYVQAYPIVELTLTDNEDKPKLRRPFTPQEYLPAGTRIEKGMQAGEELHISLTMTTDKQPLSGYRVFVRY